MNGWLIKQPDGNLQLHMDKPEKDVLGNWMSLSEYVIIKNGFPMHHILRDMKCEDEPVEVMLAPVDLVHTKISDEYFYKIAKALRPMWPAGDKSERYPWRDSVENLKKRLKTLWDIRRMKEYPLEDCIQTANIYLSRFANDTTYMQTLKYFILKQKEIVEPDGRIRYVNESKFAEMLEHVNQNNAQDEFEMLATNANVLI